MRTARRTFVATGTVAVLAAAGVTAAIAADPAPAPPPKIAFLANGIVPADALAAGPIAGQLGAPMYTTQPDSLSPAAATGLDDYDPELVIVLGGPVAIHDTVITQVENATGLNYTDDVTPAGGIVRAAGGDRFDTAAAVADLLAAYNPAYLPINMQAIDADKLDGKDSSEFALKSDLGAGGGDADTLDGKDSTDFLAADGKAQTAGHADTAGDAQTLEGREAGSFGSGALATSARNSSTVNVDGSDATLTSATVDPDDDCGDGTTNHRFVVTADARFQHDTGSESLTRMSVRIDDTAVVEPYRVLELDGTLNVGSIATTRMFDAVGPGPHTFNVIADTAAGTSRAYDSNVVVQHLGWSCGGTVSSTSSAGRTSSDEVHPDDAAAN